MPEAAPLQPGDPSRLGDYPLAGRLGEGGQGVVFLGHAPDGEPVAVKLLRARLDDGTARERFAREFAIAGQVAPFCTARVITADLDGATPYVVSEYVEGPSLQDSVRSNGPLRGAALDRLAVATATALAAIHEAGIVHRDFKPGNVLLGPDGPRVIDFGIARVLDATSTLSSQVVGTPAFLSPEQLNGERVGPGSDMFAWGSTIVYAATGTSPFGGDTVPAIMNRIAHHDPDLGPLTGPLRQVVEAALNKDPARRPTPRQVLDVMLGSGPRPATPGPGPVQAGPTGPGPAPVGPGAGRGPGAGPVGPGQAAVGPPPYGAGARSPAVTWGLIGAGLGGLVGLYLLSATTGPVGRILALSLHLTSVDVILVTVVCLIAALVAAPVGVLLGRRYPNAVAAPASGLVLLGAVLPAFAPDSIVLMAGRVLSGLGMGALLATAVLLALRTRNRTTYAIAIAGALVALLAGLLLGGVLATTVSWRWTFLIAVPPAVLAAIASIVAAATGEARR